jgi:DNA-binding response OmpR family regulator
MAPSASTSPGTSPARPRRLQVAPPPVAPAGFRARAEQAGADLDVPLEISGLVVDLPAYAATLDDVPLDLSPRQVELLALFLSEPRRVWSREQLHEVVWGQPWEPTGPSRRVDVQLCRLRSRTGLDLFRNVRDRGWVLRPQP